MQLPEIGREITSRGQICRRELQRALEDAARVLKLSLHRQNSCEVLQEFRILRGESHRGLHLRLSPGKVAGLGQLQSPVRVCSGSFT